MLLKDLFKGKKWSVGTVLIGLIALVGWALCWWIGQPVTARTYLGIVFGLIGLVLMVIVTLLWANRYLSKGWCFFTRRTWLRAHVWLAFLSVWFIVLHTGLQYGGALELTLWLLLIITIATGLWGFVMQQVWPNTMTAEGEVPYVQMTHVCEAMRRDGDELMEKVCGTELLNRAASNNLLAQSGAAATPKSPPRDPQTATAYNVAHFYVSRVRPFLEPNHQADAASIGRRLVRADFDQMRSMHLSAELNEALHQLERHYQHRSQLASQKRLHFWLQGWLTVHIPISLGLLILSIVHAVASLYY